MRSGRKKNNPSLQGVMALAFLAGVPLLLNACGNPLNGEKLSLFGPNEKRAKPPAPGQAQGQGQGQQGNGSGQSGDAACAPKTSGRLNPNDGEVSAFRAEITSIESPTGKPQPQPEDLRQQIKDYIEEKAKLGLTPDKLKETAELILGLSPEPPSSAVLASLTSPAPAVEPRLSVISDVSSETPPASPEKPPAAQPAYFLHPSIVAFVAYKTAVDFAQGPGPDHMGLSPKEAAEFGNDILALKFHENGILVYRKAYALATGDKGLGYTPLNARILLRALIGGFPNGLGLKMAVHWITEYEKNIVYDSDNPAAAVEAANKDLCYKPDPSNPLAGFYGTKPAGDTKAPPRAVRR